MAVEAAGVPTLEAVVGGLTVTVVGDDAVVAILLRQVRDNNRSGVGHALAGLLHRFVLLLLHSIHASLGLVANRHFPSLHHCSSRTLSHFFL